MERRELEHTLFLCDLAPPQNCLLAPHASFAMLVLMQC